jgi:thiol:disulfide interchange protein/DsbC/DsbD-like thiol-disulfide interchange protein
MRHILAPGLLLAAALVLPALVLPAQADPVKAEHVQAELIAENTSLNPGGDNWLALRITPESGWHIYWRNPGDSGLPTALNWTLPQGVTAGALQWPYPHRSQLGDIVNYGYDGETLLPVQLQVPAEWPAGQPVPLQAKAKWLVCKDVCIPGSADLSLSLPLAQAGTPAQADPRWRDAFSAARAELPQPAPADWKVLFAVHDGDFTLGVKVGKLSSGGAIEFFPYASDLVKHSAPQRLDNDSSGLRISQKLSDYFVKTPSQVDGVLVVHDGDSAKAWEIHAQPGAVTPVPQGAAAAPPLPQGGGAPLSLALVLLSALLGGLILNLMPCVFPVLSIKAVSLIEARGKVARHQRGHALSYTAGVLATFAVLAGVLQALRSGGQAVGWGFQLQQPVFVAAMAYLLFAMGLSLSGVVQFGTRFMGVGQGLTADGGYRGSFFTGVLAVAVASPCTVPFMGAALSYALSQPGLLSLLVFLALGLGLALPFLLIGFFPRLGLLLPKPGAWMETFKQVMAFPLYLSVVWLLWVLGGITDRSGMAAAMLGLTLLAFALWLWNRPGGTALALRALALLAALALLGSPAVRTVAAAAPAAAPAAAAAKSAIEPWSEQRVAELRSQGRTVFVDFTADWCLSCKVNEHVALDSSAVHQAFAAGDVAWLQGDWTRADPAITAELARYGHSGVPLYLMYVKGAEPQVLPQILTPDTVVDALKGVS